MAGLTSLGAYIKGKYFIRRNTGIEWSTSNPILKAGEPAFIEDTGQLKIGDGVRRFNDLPVLSGDSPGILSGSGDPTFPYQAGWFYLNTDNNWLFKSNGTSWDKLTRLGDRITIGTGTPTPETGSIGDVYINKVNNQVFTKIALTVWQFEFKITNKLFTDIIDPTPLQGSEGDIYINTKTNYLFNRTSTQWIRGDRLGFELTYGNTPPDNSMGEVGDLYINKSINSMYIKNSTSWELIAKLGDKIYSSTEDPLPNEGAVGDYHFNTTTNQFFNKIAEDQWVAVGRLGSNWITDQGIPPSTLGSDKDLYLNTLSNFYYQKESGEWKIVGNIGLKAIVVDEDPTGLAEIPSNPVVSEDQFPIGSFRVFDGINIYTTTVDRLRYIDIYNYEEIPGDWELVNINDKTPIEYPIIDKPIKFGKSSGYSNLFDPALTETLVLNNNWNPATPAKILATGISSIGAIDKGRVTRFLLRRFLWIHVESISITPESATLIYNLTNPTAPVSETLQLVTELLPTDSLQKEVTYVSSDPSVAIVDVNTGLVTSKFKGVTTITGTTKDGGLIDTSVITVVIPVTGVAYDIATKKGIVLLSRTLNINFTISPTLNIGTPPVKTEVASDLTYTWEVVDPTIASVVDGSPSIPTSINATGTKLGVTNIIIKTNDGEFVDTFELTVNPVIVTAIELNSTTLNLNKGVANQFTWTFTPLDSTNKTVTFTSSNESIGTIDSNGLFLALNVGTTTVTIKTEDGNKTATCVITVRVFVEAISIPSTYNLNINEEIVIPYTTIPLDATNQTVTIQSSNDSVVSVNPTTKKMKGLTVGESTITVVSEDGGFVGQMVVTVGIFPVTSFTMTPNTGLLFSNIVDQKELQLQWVIEPDYATNKSVTFTSSDPTIATVSATGLIKSIDNKDGFVTITGKTVDGEITDTCALNVMVGVTKIDTDPPSLPDNQSSKNITLNTGDTYQLTYLVLPNIATDPSVTRQVDPSEYFSVDDANLLTAIHAGEGGVIRFVSNSNNNIVLGYNVSVNYDAPTSLIINELANPDGQTEGGDPYINLFRSEQTDPDTGITKVIFMGGLTITIEPEYGDPHVVWTIDPNGTNYIESDTGVIAIPEEGLSVGEHLFIVTVTSSVNTALTSTMRVRAVVPE